MKTMIMIAALMVSVNCFAQAKSDKFVNKDLYNVENQVSVRTVYRTDGRTEEPCIQNTYKYDGENRVITREVSKWDKDGQHWQPDYQLRYSYVGGNTTVDYVPWDAATESFNKIFERSVYNPSDDGQTLSLLKYKRQDADSAIQLVEQYDHLLLSNHPLMSWTR